MLSSPQPLCRAATQSRARRESARGYTLIEILIVIAIVGILAAILLPAFSRVRDGSRTVTCASNLRQLGLGMQLYRNDFNNRYPPYGGLIGKSPDCAWPEFIYPYIRSTSVFWCPSFPLGEYRTGCPESEVEEDDATRTYKYDGSYGLNWLDVPGVQGPSDARVRNPSEVILMIDASPHFLTPQARDPQLDPASIEGLSHMGVAVPARHNDRNNALFADGHVKALRLPQLADRKHWLLD